MNRKFILALVAGASAAALSLSGCHGRANADDSGDAGENETTLVTVEAGQLRHATLHAYVNGYGEVQPAPATADAPAATAKVAPAQAGVVLRVHVVEGSKVKAGDRLVDLDDRAAKVSVKYAEETAKRQQTLYAEHNTSLKALQDAEAALATAKAQLDFLHATAPLSGTVTRVNVRPGEAVDLSTVLVEITDLTRLVVTAEIPAVHAGELSPGEPMEISGKKPVETQLDYVSPAVDPANGTVTVRAALPPESAFRAGALVPLRITVGEHHDVLVAPSDSVVNDENDHPVVSIISNDEASRVPVNVGYRDNGLVEISGEGLKAGDTVVTVGAYGLPAKTKVQIAKSEPKP